MSKWNALHYLKYSNERTRAAADLAARIKLKSPVTIADLGCGSGNSTQILHERWTEADIIGLDSSAEMLESARKTFPEQKWILVDISEWTPDRSFDLLYSNAALHWIPNHNILMRQLFANVSPGGALAFQIPSRTYPVVRTIIHEISRNPLWDDKMNESRNTLSMENPSYYYDALVNYATDLDIWETEYNHIMDSKEAIIDWISSTGLRPFLAVLDDEIERKAFLDQLYERIDAKYEARVDGKVLFPFRRLFVIAYR